MALLDLQRKLHECGRLRLGTKSAKGFPTKLETWRATSQSKEFIQAIADLYGGEVAAWKADPKGPQQWECITDSSSMEIIVAPGETLSQYWELWNAGGCLRRCDGYVEMKSDGPCLCPTDHDERRKGAAQRTPTACKPTTRVSVILRDIPAIGLWRIETRGIYAAMELSGMTEILEMATRRNIYLPATLRLDTRTSKEGGQTNRYAVPVIDLHRTFGQVAKAIGMDLHMNELDGPTPVSISAPPLRALPAQSTAVPGVVETRQEQEGEAGAPTTPAPASPNPSTWKPIPVVEDVPIDAEVVADQITRVVAPGANRAPRKNAAEPIKSTGLKPRGRPVTDEAPKKPAFPQFAINQPAPAAVEAPSAPTRDVEPPVAAVAGGEPVAIQAPPGDNPPIPLAPSQPARPDSNPGSLRAPLSRAQQLAIAAKKAEIDDTLKGDLVAHVTSKRTRSTTEVDDKEAGDLHLLFSQIRRGKTQVSYTEDGQVVLS